MPTPLQTENRGEFITRCLADPVMQNEFSVDTQRLAVCERQWENNNKFYAKNMKVKTVTSIKELEEGFGKDKIVFQTKGELKMDKADKKTVINLSVQMVDRDNEVVLIDGIKLPRDNSVPMLDAHNSHGSVVDNQYGRVTNLRKVEIDGVKVLQGEPVWTPCYDKNGNLVNPRAKAAQLMVEAGIAKTVSIGFAVFDYDYEDRLIKESELYELSLVSVPANPAAVIDVGKKAADETIKELEKRVKYYSDILPRIKSYRQLFMSKELCDILDYEKTGNEIEDIANLYDLVMQRMAKGEETPNPHEKQKETPMLTRETVKAMLIQELSKNAKLT